MGRFQRQPRVASLLRVLRLFPANLIICALMMALFPPKLQPVRQLAQPRSNNELRNNNQSSLSSSALEEEYTEFIQAEIAFPPNIKDNNVHSFIL